MFSRHKQEVYLPGWLWFFLILPILLVVTLLYRQKRLPRLSQRLSSLPRPFNPTPRYTEPDSIPLEIRTGETVETEAETSTDTENIPTTKTRAVRTTVMEQPQGEAVPATPDDLKIIEGIGPSISGLLRESGIATFRQLAETSVERLDEILTSAQLRRLADPGTWPEQARLAAEGNWDGLKQLQNTLKAGRRSK